ncbi:hypothetical protein LR48_Vigan09g078500 [Vigna angularis]|uniref:Uncharacterized protein n=1 Tax=Phaseolus angularis TaxID=3914 RepID=A0A0L9VAN3_PHAAN|nr:hypothetical protein LR48_Vigan09g078500 [Vigna angularis]
MASSSSRRGKKAAQFVRNASRNGWINDDEERYKFGCYRKLFEVVPHKFFDLELFRREGFLFQKWLVDVGLAKFVEMTVDCYLDLVEVFYHNMKVVDGLICSRVKGVDIKIDDEIWLSFTGLKDVEETPSTFTPHIVFERFVVDQFRRLPTRISKVEKSLIMIHKKLDEDNALRTSSASESDDEDDTTEDESMDTSDSD